MTDWPGTPKIMADYLFEQYADKELRVTHAKSILNILPSIGRKQDITSHSARRSFWLAVLSIVEHGNPRR